MSKFVAVIIDEKLDIHAHGVSGNYATLCGVDGDDPTIGMKPAKLPKNSKITCHACWAIFSASRELRASDFSPEARRP